MTDDLAFTTAEALIRLAADPAAFEARLRDLQSQTATALEAKAAAEAAAALLAEREAAVAQQQAKLNEREHEVASREAHLHFSVKDATERLRKSYLSQVELDSAIKRRVLRFAGMLEGFSSPLQQLPEWSSIERMLGEPVDEIVELQPESTVLTREGFGSDKFSEQSTLTRSMPVMASMNEHDDLPTPMPVNRSPVRSSRRARRAAEGRTNA